MPMHGLSREHRTEKTLMICTFRKHGSTHGSTKANKEERGQTIGRDHSLSEEVLSSEVSEVEKMIVTLLLFFFIIGSAALNPSTRRPSRYATYLRSSFDSKTPICNGYSVRDSWALVVGKFSFIRVLVRLFDSYGAM
jgi:hypothetical protein